MNVMYRPAVFTIKKQHSIIFSANRRYLLNQRCTLRSSKEINAGILVLLLNDYFPGLLFIPRQDVKGISERRISGNPRMPVPNNLGIVNYVAEKNGAWTLDIAAMSRSGEKCFAALFPDNISSWDENKAREKYGCADIIRFFIDAENNEFLVEFNKLKGAGSAKISGSHVPDGFFEKADYPGKPVWEDWDFSGFVLHKMRHNPPSIYEAFGYYGHRYYTLCGFGLDSTADNRTETDLYKSGLDRLNKAMGDAVSNMEALISKQGAGFFELIHETLESVPAGSSVYTPTDINTFIKQIKSRMPDLYRHSPSGNNTDPYTPGDKKTINNHLDKVGEYVDDADGREELRKTRLSGTYREKINLLHRLRSKPSVRAHYDARELDIIHGLYLKQFTPVSLDGKLGGDEEDAFTGYDVTGDERFPNPEERLIWTSFFREEFEKEFDPGRLEIFLECLPGHFAQYPFDADAGGNLRMSKYSKKNLFSTFCSVAGIAPDNELWKPFLVLIQRVVDNINRS
jgi:hypothetical protein